jgi:AraC-like DNA-binding protein
MNQVVFNFHDVILLMTAMLCVLFSALLVATNPPKNISNYFLAAFLLTHALIPLHELMMWGAEFKHTVRNNFPQIYFVGSFAYYIDAALLYFYVKSLIFRDFHIRRKDYYHLIPIVLFAIFMFATYFRFPLVQRLVWINNEIFVYSAHYITSDFLCKIMRVVYCVACFRLILKYKDLLKATHSNIEKVDVFWLKLLVIGFLIVTIMEASLAVAKVIGLVIDFNFHQLNLPIIEFIGLSGYYATFFLVCTLVFTSMRYFANFEAIRQKKEPEPAKKPVQEKLLNPEYAEKIDNLMRSDKPYLMADITLDILAEKLAIPARDLSMIINRHFDNNFYEFINNYRIEEAKKILIDPKNKDKTITDVYLEVGFNSKSVFNTFFKKIVGQTPTEYRQVRQAPELAT